MPFAPPTLVLLTGMEFGFRIEAKPAPPPPSVSGSVHDWQRSAHENKQNILRSASRNSQDPSGVYGAEVPAPQEQKSLSDGDGGTGGPGGGARSRPDDRHPQSCHHPFKGWRSWKEW